MLAAGGQVWPLPLDLIVSPRLKLSHVISTGSGLRRVEPDRNAPRPRPAPGAARCGSRSAWAPPGDVETVIRSAGNVHVDGNGPMNITARTSNRLRSAGCVKGM